MNNLFKLIVLGGIGYVIYKYYYIPLKQKEYTESLLPPHNINDGRTTFYGKDKYDYIRGFPMPDKITDIKENVIDVITKPNVIVFNQVGRTSFKVSLNKDANRVIYNSGDTDGKQYNADYDAVKDKLVMNEDYTV